jgi:hypothetical protein
MTWLIGEWRTRSKLLLAMYLILAGAEAVLIHLGGIGHGSSAAVAAKYGSGLDMIAYLFFTWRIWRAGRLSWGLSVVWKVGSVVWVLFATVKDPDPYLAAILAVSLLSTAVLFAPAVVGRVFGRAAPAGLSPAGGAQPEPART